MTAYIVASIDVHDPEQYEAYKSAVIASITAYGGKYLVRGGKILRLEGDWNPKRFVVVEFPSAAQAKAWWESTDYAGPKRLRQSSAETDMFIVEGV
jgi:uncharacterized protein (DUF1330 family)